MFTLSDADQRLCRTLARLRYLNNREHDVTNARVGDQSDELTDLEGIGGEFAFCRMFGVEPDTSIATRSALQGEDGNYDAIINGRTVDVKTTRYATGHLLAVPWKSGCNPADAYVLMVGTFPSYRFAGWMLGIELVQPSRLTTKFGHGPTYAARQDELCKDM